ncbi:hypothetical protein HN51_008589 [Arachis hypogaea]|uniref:Uncharacterized protein LOC107490311 n=2 Tax=Arachis TaxID=3817 RepID=A0A6P4DLS9_ARADU|nr:uncharacterized protein LOC107490311 [Arachis duranensis]XP_025700896.1 uncharacterized protein LOC112802092 [Arachis hypogaea]XP_052117916.1 uncharacterized protein LOC107490311 [Arachis duranensis]QHO42918.1 uncharacterized protein DS421_5g158390 [Arachis hypogaea]RYR57541.1 hypothetical protein Ahy_A05g023251 [Arachis hypogaea]
MPLYDCMLLFKPHIQKKDLLDLVTRVGKHVCRRNGVVTGVKSFGEVQLGYGIKKLDGRHFKGYLMQLSMMATPEINKELHYLNKEDRLLRWLLVKQRDFRFGNEFFSEQGALELSNLSQIRRPDDDEDDDDDDDEDEYEVDEETK